VSSFIETPRNARSRRTRKALLDNALELIVEEGAEALSVAEVARRAGVTRRAVYLHFGSRGELLLELFGHINEVLDLESSLRPMLEAPDALSALDAWAAHVARFHGRLLPIARAVDAARRTDAEVDGLWQRAMAAWHGACHGLVGRLAEEGRLAEPWSEEDATDLLWALMSVELLEDLVEDRGWPPDRYAERLALVARRVLAVEA